MNNKYIKAIRVNKLVGIIGIILTKLKHSYKDKRKR